MGTPAVIGFEDSGVCAGMDYDGYPHVVLPVIFDNFIEAFKKSEDPRLYFMRILDNLFEYGAETGYEPENPLYTYTIGSDSHCAWVTIEGIEFDEDVEEDFPAMLEELGIEEYEDYIHEFKYDGENFKVKIVLCPTSG